MGVRTRSALLTGTSARASAEKRCAVEIARFVLHKLAGRLRRVGTEPNTWITLNFAWHSASEENSRKGAMQLASLRTSEQQVENMRAPPTGTSDVGLRSKNYANSVKGILSQSEDGAAGNC